MRPVITGLMTPWMVFSLAAILQAQVAADADLWSGCPSYGCTPSGTFSFSSDIPVKSGNQTVGTKWTVLISATSGQTQLGCVSCQEGIVCPTYSGYVAVDPDTGKLIWRFDNMTSPSMPILDIYGDVIGTDGNILVKIDSDGEVEKPVIEIYNHLAPMYSIQVTDENQFLMTSQVSGELITYGVDGIPGGSLILQAVVDGVDGSFVPSAQPVITGNRAYILMQFQPYSPQDRSSGLQRLYAVDLWDRMVDLIDPVWFVSFQTYSCSVRTGVSTAAEANVLVHNNTVYVSLGGTSAGVRCHPRRRGVKSAEEEGMLWAFYDNGTAPLTLFKIVAPVSSLSLYDVSVETRPKQTTLNPVGKGTSSSFPVLRGNPVLWAATDQRITGYDSLNGSTIYLIDISELLNVSCALTSKVMVARSQDGNSDRLVFAVSEFASGKKFGQLTTNTTQSFVVAVDVAVASEGGVQLLWKVTAKPGTTVVGQIANILLAPSAGEKIRTKDGKRHTVDDGSDKKSDDVQVILVAAAVSDSEQYVFAIGRN